MVELWEYILNSCPSHLPVPVELLQIGAVLGCTQVSSCSSYLPVPIELLQIGAVLGCTQVSSCSSYLPVPIELLQIGAVLGCTQVSSCFSYLPVHRIIPDRSSPWMCTGQFLFFLSSCFIQSYFRQIWIQHSSSYSIMF